MMSEPRAAVRISSVPEQLGRLDDLVDQCEHALVNLLDARGGLEDRISPILNDLTPVEAMEMTANRILSPEPRCNVAINLAKEVDRLERLLVSIETEARQLRGITARVEV